MHSALRTVATHIMTVLLSCLVNNAVNPLFSKGKHKTETRIFLTF